MMEQYKVTLQDAREVASALVNAPGVIAVELIGSVARNGIGNDLDIVVTVNAFRYATYVLEVCGVWNDSRDYYSDFAAERLQAALDVLTLPPTVRAWLELAAKNFKLDVQVMPRGWQKHIDEVQKHLPHADADFVNNIAKDARPFIVSVKKGVKRATLAK